MGDSPTGSVRLPHRYDPINSPDSPLPISPTNKILSTRPAETLTLTDSFILKKARDVNTDDRETKKIK